jgi:uncharacterized protein YjbI with pentapeptide repeats
MSDPDGFAFAEDLPGAADGEVVESREQLQHLAREGALRARTYRDLHLTGLRLQRPDFGGATFERVTLGAAELEGADLSGATFTQVDLRGAQLSGALVQRASLGDCDLTEAVLRGAVCADLALERSRLMNLDFDGGKLRGCRFSGCSLYGVKLRQAVLVRCAFGDPAPNGAAELTRAQLRGALLIDCDLDGANLYRADLGGALLVRCNLSRAMLTGATVEGARFIDCRFTGADLPDGLRPA